MKSFITILASLLFVTCSLAAEEEPDKRTPLDRYYVHTDSSMYICPSVMRTAIAKAEMGKELGEDDDYRRCIEREKVTANKYLTKALRTIKKPKAQDALKSYHVAYLTALKGITPGTNERKISYEQRTQKLKEKLTEAWARFEVEQ